MVNAPCWPGSPSSGPDTRLQRSREFPSGGCPPAQTCGVAEVEPDRGHSAGSVLYPGGEWMHSGHWRQDLQPLQFWIVGRGDDEVVYGLFVGVAYNDHARRIRRCSAYRYGDLDGL